jgi:hypothetical protein
MCASLPCTKPNDDASTRSRMISRRTVIAAPIAFAVAATLPNVLEETSTAQAYTCGNWGFYGYERWCTCGSCSGGQQQRQCKYVYNRWCCDDYGCWLQWWYIGGSCLGGYCGPCGAYLGDGC